MFSLSSAQRYYLYEGPCDMRKSFDGLCGLVLGAISRRPDTGEVFVFLNKRRTHLKLLHWEPGGFVLYYKRLERGCFRRPEAIKNEIGYSDLVLMIEGIEVLKSRRQKRYKKPDLMG